VLQQAVMFVEFVSWLEVVYLSCVGVHRGCLQKRDYGITDGRIIGLKD
jgi:hypothetical protein